MELMDKAKEFVGDKVANIKKPEASVDDVDLKHVGRDGVTYLATVAVVNPYGVSIPVGEITYTLKSVDRVIASGNIPDPGSLKGNDKTVLEVEMKAPHSVLVSLMKDLGADWDVDYTVEIGIVVDLPIVGNFTIPITHKAMLKNSEQILPLGAAADSPFISDDKPKTAAATLHDRCIKCCGCAAALLLILTTIAAILASTVFRLRGPIVRVGNLTIGSFQLSSRRNVTLYADVWVKNPNFASIDYGNMTTTLFYRGVAVGESRAPPGTARARRAATIGATVVIMADRITSLPDLEADIVSGLVNVSSYTRVGGKINLGIFEKQVAMKMSCNVSINVTSRAIQQHKCRRKFKL